MTKRNRPAPAKWTPRVKLPGEATANTFDIRVENYNPASPDTHRRVGLPEDRIEGVSDMSPGHWVAIILGVVAGCWLAAFLAEVANGTPEERKVYAAKRAQQDAEDLLRGEKL